MNVLVSESQYSSTDSLQLEDFEEISRIALREFGLSLPKSKRQLVESRLARRVRALNLDGYKEYRELVCGPTGKNEWPELLSSLTTNVTKFFREIHHFETLKNSVMPVLIEKAQKGERVRIWSAGCSSGQEPYSIAMTALKCNAKINQYNFKILATDIDPNILEKARLAKYQRSEIASISSEFYRHSDIEGDRKNPDDLFSPSNNVRSLVTFGRLNLISKIPFSGSFDVIFCRNVAIYFDNKTQNSVWRKFSNLLPSDGKLFIGHSERIRTGDQPSLVPDGITTYRKI